MKGHEAAERGLAWLGHERLGREKLGRERLGRLTGSRDRTGRLGLRRHCIAQGKTGVFCHRETRGRACTDAGRNE